MATMQVLSDLHLETPKSYDLFDITPKADYLALLGDIGNIVPHREECLAFLRRQLQHFRVILLVPGNHEAFGSSWSEAMAVLRQFEEEISQQRRESHGAGLGEFVLLDRGLFELPTDDGKKITVLGCSLFSHVPPQRAMNVEMGLNDFYHTTDWDICKHNEAHSRDLTWLNEQVSRIQGQDSAKIIVFTHWSPSTDTRSTDPKHANSAINSAFSTDLSDQLCFTSDKVVLWVFGHTHYNCDFEVERKEAKPLRLVTNQRGYYFAQAAGFDVEKIIEI
ncbi:hypothetical protein M409DRAFT_61418 [Zasmidium cellare ATCC 36951]|uniref:Calcineurin-like phosphoesterase domain-containing protein n=1 Tax=Zasmidium cellare ATCC 36951 TaxID=1080233 RepID=A0A6A6BV79_ZASCE|nr:uncharacterized protein M409DRAFT_61418 [Zasmidium cellare ATCC 36951]KAF2158697.1 hypothetical protein M409DRAFT_61418 [Zasmidium cellare ATCC 36951]